MVDRESVITPPVYYEQPSGSRRHQVLLLLRPHVGGLLPVVLVLLLLLLVMASRVTAMPSPSASLSAETTAASDGRRPSKISEQQETVENLVKQWAPLVWLAPGELFMPGNVNDFLGHVHAQKSTPAAASIMHQTADILDVSDDVLLYELDREIGVTEHAAKIANHDETLPPTLTSSLDRRERRISFLDRVIDLPIGKRSMDWYLVSNGDIDNELLNTSSFLYGKDPNSVPVPIYSVISICDHFDTQLYDKHINDIDNVDRIDHVSYIPIRNQPETFPYKFEKPVNRSQMMPVMTPRNLSVRSRRETLNKNTTNVAQHNKSSQPIRSTHPIPNLRFRSTEKYARKSTVRPDESKRKLARIPHFHVTYWMFYPYNQGKTICTLNLGPFGRLPIPVLFGKCLGTRRDFGSHVGDWEHMTLFFKGRNEPEEMYVSAHDAGAYYTYERLSGSFEFRRQETRKGILQHPNFPKTVRTINDHPVLFSAQGSHGLWTAPGKHRFVRVPKLVDINGFGTPWYTWKNIEFSYDRRDRRDGRAPTMIGPDWLQFMGKWGNPKSKCHPMKRLGLNFCEYNDGPTGIPMKEPHFFCKRP